MLGSGQDEGELAGDLDGRVQRNIINFGYFAVIGQLELIHYALFDTVDVAEIGVFEFEGVDRTIGNQTGYFGIVFIYIQEEKLLFSQNHQIMVQFLSLHNRMLCYNLLQCVVLPIHYTDQSCPINQNKVSIVGVLRNKHTVNFYAIFVTYFQRKLQLNYCFFVIQLASVEMKQSVVVVLNEVSVLVACRYNNSCILFVRVDQICFQRVEIISFFEHHGVVKVILVRDPNARDHIHLLYSHFFVFIFKNYLCKPINFQFK